MIIKQIPIYTVHEQTIVLRGEEEASRQVCIYKTVSRQGGALTPRQRPSQH